MRMKKLINEAGISKKVDSSNSDASENLQQQHNQQTLGIKLLAFDGSRINNRTSTISDQLLVRESTFGTTKQTISVHDAVNATENPLFSFTFASDNACNDFPAAGATETYNKRSAANQIKLRNMKHSVVTDPDTTAAGVLENTETVNFSQQDSLGSKHRRSLVANYKDVAGIIAECTSRYRQHAVAELKASHSELAAPNHDFVQLQRRQELLQLVSQLSSTFQCDSAPEAEPGLNCEDAGLLSLRENICVGRKGIEGLPCIDDGTVLDSGVVLESGVALDDQTDSLHKNSIVHLPASSAQQVAAAHANSQSCLIAAGGASSARDVLHAKKQASSIQLTTGAVSERPTCLVSPALDVNMKNASQRTHNTLQSEANKQLHATISRLMMKPSAPVLASSIERGSEILSKPTKTLPSKLMSPHPVSKVLSTLQRWRPLLTIGNLCDSWCEQIWPTSPVIEVMQAHGDSRTHRSTFLDLAPTTFFSKAKGRVVSSDRIISPPHSCSVSFTKRAKFSLSHDLQAQLEPNKTQESHSNMAGGFGATSLSRRDGHLREPFDDSAVICASSAINLKLRMQQLAQYDREQSALSLAIHVRNFLRPNLNILNACTRQLSDGFAECWAPQLERSRATSLRFKKNVMSQPETTIENFFITIQSFMVGLLRLECNFAGKCIPGFWHLSSAVRAACLSANISATFLAVFGRIISVEDRNTCIDLTDMQLDGVENDSTVDGTATSSANIVCTIYWFQHFVPAPAYIFYMKTAAFVRQLDLPDTLSAVLAATVFSRPVRMEYIPDSVREQVQDRMGRSSGASSREQWCRDQSELAETHEYSFRLLHQLIAQQQLKRQDDGACARVMYNKIVFFLAALSERLTVYDCCVIQATPLHFYDDGSYDWKRLEHHVSSSCSPQVGRWLNAVWPVMERIDFSRIDFSIDDILLDIERVASL